jgi:hypothetical protein
MRVCWNFTTQLTSDAIYYVSAKELGETIGGENYFWYHQKTQ